MNKKLMFVLLSIGFLLAFSAASFAEVTTETLEDGTIIETHTDDAGNVLEVIKIVHNPDGSVTRTHYKSRTDLDNDSPSSPTWTKKVTIKQSPNGKDIIETLYPNGKKVTVIPTDAGTPYDGKTIIQYPDGSAMLEEGSTNPTPDTTETQEDGTVIKTYTTSSGKVIKITENPDGSTDVEILLEDGVTIVKVHYEGGVIITQGNGVTTVEAADGEGNTPVIVVSKTGQISIISPGHDGRTPDNGGTQEDIVIGGDEGDGTPVEPGPWIKILPHPEDGVIAIVYISSGEKIYKIYENGDREIDFQGKGDLRGTRIIKHADGSITVILPDGTEQEYDNGKITENEDGSVDIKHEDGSTTHIEGDGDVEEKNPETDEFDEDEVVTITEIPAQE